MSAQERSRKGLGVHERGIGMIELLGDVAKGLVSLAILVFFPAAWLLSQLLPYGLTCLFTGRRLRKGYRYLYFLPRFVKEMTAPLRRKR